MKPNRNEIIESGSQVVGLVNVLITKLDDVMLLTQDVSDKLTKPQKAPALAKGHY